MPVFSNFRSTTVWHAFVLNAMATTVAIFVAMVIKIHLDTFTDKRGHEIVHKTNIKSTIVTLASTFLAAFGSYTVLYFLFGFGGGMLVTE